MLVDSMDPPPKPQPSEGFGELNCGTKSSLARNVDMSINRVSIMRSNVPRFADQSKDSVPFGCYDLDQGHRKTIESRLRDNRRFYRASFNEAARLGKMQMTEGPDIMYDPARLKSSSWSTLGLAMLNSPMKYSIIHSRFPRTSKLVMTAAPDVTYDTNRGAKASMVKAVLESPVKYSCMQKHRHRVPLHEEPADEAPLGPGSYDYPYIRDVKSSPHQGTQPLSSLVSESRRFVTDRVDAYRNLGSSWTQDKDTQEWARRSFVISKAQYRRPPYLPKALDTPASEAS